MKRAFAPLLSVVLTLLCFVLLRPEANAQALSTGFCQYLYSAIGGPLSYPCPAPTATPAVAGIKGFSAFTFGDSVGINVHMVDTEYNNLSFVTNLLKALNIHHIRDGLSVIPGNSYVINAYNTLAANGIHSDLLSNQGLTQANLASLLGQLNPGVVDALEGPNELDICCGDSSWQLDDAFEMQQVLFPYARANLSGVKVFGPATGFSSYAGIGDLSYYEDYGNMHDYEAGFYPETTGWGGPGYCGLIYATIAYNACNAAQASVTKPIIATEFGYQDSPYVQNQSDDVAQGTFILRQIFQHMLLGYPKSYIYELLDTGGQTYGLATTYGDYFRPSFSEIAGFMQIINDTAPTSGACVVPAKITASGIDSFGLCKTTGEYDLVMWQPAVTYDTNALTVNTFAPINAVITPNAGFTPTNVSQWSYNVAGVWSNNASVSLSSVPVTDRPTVLVFNGASASPTPVPALPTFPPTPAPTATPYVSPTPTPAPTATPTAVAIRQFTGTINSSNNQVNVTQTFASPVQYGDYFLTGWAFDQYGASRYIVSAPSILSRIAPSANAETNLPIQIACSPITDYQGYEQSCLDLWGGYISNQAGAGTAFPYVASGGDTNSSVAYDLTGVDASAPIAQISPANLEEFNTTTCPSVTVARPGSMAICFVAAKNGTGFGPGTGITSGFNGSSGANGWIFDMNEFPPEGVTYAFHYPVTTTANQVVPSFTFTNTSTYIDYTVAETLVLQPPAH